jgi:hypothetical protein
VRRIRENGDAEREHGLNLLRPGTRAILRPE